MIITVIITMNVTMIMMYIIMLHISKIPVCPGSRYCSRKFCVFWVAILQCTSFENIRGGRALLPPSSAVPENKKLSLLRRQRWVMVNEVCMTWWWLMRQRQKLEWGLAPLSDSLGVFGPSISPSHTDPIYTPFAITQHVRSFILPRKCPNRVACGGGYKKLKNNSYITRKF